MIKTTGAFTCERKDDKTLMILLEKFENVHKENMKTCKFIEDCISLI